MRTWRGGARASPDLAFNPPPEVGNSRAERLRNSDDAENAGIADPSFNAADVARIKVGFFSQLLLCELLSLTGSLRRFEPKAVSARCRCAMPHSLDYESREYESSRAGD